MGNRKVKNVNCIHHYDFGFSRTHGVCKKCGTEIITPDYGDVNEFKSFNVPTDEYLAAIRELYQLKKEVLPEVFEVVSI